MWGACWQLQVGSYFFLRANSDYCVMQLKQKGSAASYYLVVQWSTASSGLFFFFEGNFWLPRSKISYFTRREVRFSSWQDLVRGRCSLDARRQILFVGAVSLSEILPQRKDEYRVSKTTHVVGLAIGRLRVVGSLKSYVSLAKEPY